MSPYSGIQSRQRGVALAVSLILLAVASIIAITAVRFTSLDMRIAFNEELRTESMQTAQSIVDGVAARDSNFVVFGGTGYSVCTTNLQGCAACDRSTIELQDALLAPLLDQGIAEARVRLNSETDSAPPRRGPERGFSHRVFRAAHFEVQSSYDGPARNEVVEGRLLIFGVPQ